MCGGCGGGPFDEMGRLVSGPRRRAAVAAAAARQAQQLRIRVVGRAWSVSEKTGKVTVCRTVDELLDVLERTGTPRSKILSALLAAAETAPTPS